MVIEPERLIKIPARMDLASWPLGFVKRCSTRIGGAGIFERPLNGWNPTDCIVQDEIGIAASCLCNPRLTACPSSIAADGPEDMADR